MKTQVFKVNGMTCSGCVRTVQTILQNTDGVEAVEVHLEPAEARVDYNEELVSPSKLAEKIGQVGYEMELG